MKKKSLLLMLLMALLVPWAANAQATLPIGDGTSYATSGNSAGQTLGSPFGNTWYYNSTAQIIYTASELDGAKTINSLAFYHNANSFSATVKIYLAHTTSSTIDPDSPATDGTLVYTGTGISLGGSSAGWQTFTFDTNFEYNGTDNLLVVVCRTKYNSGYSQSQGWQYTATTNNMCMSRCSDTDAYGLITNTSYSYTATTNRPNVIIGYVPTTPFISLDPTSETVLVGLSKTITATYGNVSGTPTITYSSSNPKIASVSGSGTSATVTGESVGTATITATMTYNATDYTATCAVTVEEPSYCKPSFSYTSDYINSFTTTGGEQNIDNQNSGQGTGGYSNFYDTHFVSAEPETEIGFSVVRGYDDNYNYAIWVDWNKDYEFDNTTEKVAYTTSSTGDWTGTFTIPTTAAAGDYHMRVIQVYSYAATPCVSASYGEGEDYKLTVIAASPYQKPVNLQVSNLTAATATITWEAPNSDVQSYKYQYREAGGSWSALTSTTALSAPLTVLTGNTTYEFQVQAIYAGNNESAFASTSFTTPCDAFSIDPTAYQYGFETADDMDCWELVNGVTNTAVWDNATIDYNFGYEPARTGDYCFMFFYVDYDDTDPEYQTLISPELTDLPANGVHVEFYYVRDLGGSGQETFRVGYSTTDKNLSSFTWGTEITDASTAYQRFSANYPQGTKYVAVQHTSDDQYYLFLDDFTFEGAADCLEPSSVLADNITTTGASINWTAGGEEVAWDIYVTDDATIVPDDGTTPTYANISTKPYPLTPLTPATTYYVYVRAACKGTETSAWSTPAIFHTECEGMDLPYGPYGFEDGALSVCWNVINTNTSYNSASVSNSNPNTGTFSLSFFRGSTTGDLVAVLPEVGAYDLSDYQFEFSAMGGYAGYEITIGIMTDPDNLTTFVAQGDVITTTTSYAEHKVRFNEYTGSGKYVAIKVVRPSTVTYGSIYVDDIAINPIPSCIEPSGLAVSDETAHGATFSWTNGGSETEWHLYVSTENNAPADDINLKEVIVADSNPFILTTGLDPETDYYVWVRANCGSTDGYSTWVGPETFTTGIACPAPTGLAASEITGHTAKLSWNGTSDEYNVEYRTSAYVIPTKEEGFEHAGSLPEDWTHIGSGSTTINTTSSRVHTGSYSLRFSGATSNNVYVAPDLGVEINTLAITFWSLAEHSTKSGTFQVGYVTDATDASTFQQIDSYNASAHLSYTEVKNVSLASAPDGARIAFRHTSADSGYWWWIDDIVIGTPVAEGTWQTLVPNPTTTTANLTGLDAETKYDVRVQGDCGGEGTSQWSNIFSFTTDIACPAPSALTPSNPTSVSFDLSWNNGGASDWIVAYKKTTETDFTEISLNISDVTEEAGVISYTLGGLDDDIEYTVKVRDNCEPSYTGDGVSDWTDEVTYSTIPACSAMNPVVSNITHHTAKVDWDGESTSGYTVKYRESALVSTENPVFYEAFNTNSSTPPTGWTRYSGLVDAVIAGSTSLTTVTTGWYTNSDHALGSYNAKLNIYGINVKHWLVTPEVVLTNGLSLSFDLALTDYGNGNAIEYPEQQPDDRFVVLVFADDAWHILREWNNSGSPYVYNTIATTGENVVLDLAAYAGKTIKVAFYGESTVSGASSGVDDNDLHIDNVLIGTTIPAGDWQTQAAATTTANLSGLTAGTMYDVKIVPNCDPTQESNIANFNTLSSDKKYFLTEGEWETAANWMDGEIPTSTDDAIIRANVTITNYAEAKDVTFEGTPTPEILIEDGAEFVHNNTVNASYQKLVYGYGDPSNPGGWNFIASPVNSFSTNYMPDGPYDLYKYDEPAASWYSNTGEHSFTSLTRGIGYLYANQQNVTWNFTGSMIGTNTEVTKTLSFAYSHITDPDGVKGFNLMGNPYTRNLEYGDVTIGDEAMTAFLRLDNGDDYEPCNMYDGDEILPGQGFFYQVDAAGKSMKFKKATAKDANEIGLISIVAGNDSKVDKAFVQIGGGNTLRKIAFSNSKSSVYVINDGDDYAAATIYELAGTMPVHFKAVAEGEYDITVNTKNIEASTLLLFDNFKNETIDLLETPTYSFKSSADDPENRFKLIFDFNNNNNYNGVEDNFTSEIFVYQSGDELIVNGEGDLQIFDVLGRLVTSKNISGIERVSKPAQTGVYIFRLNEHTQKLIIK